MYLIGNKIRVNIFSKRFLFLLICLPIFSFSCFSQHAAEKKTRGKTEHSKKKQLSKLQKKNKIYLDGMQFIPAGTFTSGRTAQYLTAENEDSTLLVGTLERRDTVSDFFISDHEVTNAEYRQFTNWVKDSIALSLLAVHDDSWYADKEKKILNWKKRKDIWKFDTLKAKILEPLYQINPGKFNRPKIDNGKLIYAYKSNGNIIPLQVYPDEERFLKENGNRWDRHYTSYYSNDHIYDDYPVVGVTWHQAHAYCQWRSEQFNNVDKSKKNAFVTEFRLPSEKEWEYAALSLTGYSQYENIYAQKGEFPWGGSGLIDQNGRYRANFGEIQAQNGYMLKQFHDDGGFYPLKVKSYKPNDFKLYDMAGNVAEWTNTRPGKIEQQINEEWYFFFIYYFSHHISRDDLSNNRQHKLLMQQNIPLAPTLDSIRKVTAVNYLESAESTNQKIRQRFSLYHQLIFNRIPDDTILQKMADFAISAAGPYSEELTRVELQNSRVMYLNPRPRIVKGGSWASGPAYLLCGSREAFSEDKCSSRIGFRVLIEMKANP
jgi:sulfatase modifying factor 1